MNFYSLPTELQQTIYEFDSTYKDIFDGIIQRGIPASCRVCLGNPKKVFDNRASLEFNETEWRYAIKLTCRLCGLEVCTSILKKSLE